MSELKIELIAIGDELLMGHTLDSNSHWIARKLAESGMRLAGMRWSADEETVLLNHLANVWGQSDIVILCGGLGPTHDDVTRPILAKFFDDQLEHRSDLAGMLLDRFRRRGIDPSPGWEAMVTFPKGAAAIPNNAGAAPGIHYVRDGKQLFAAPGVPAEMKGMVEDYVLPRIKDLRRGVYRFRTIRTVGAGESRLSSMIGDPFGLLPARLAFLPGVETGVTLRLSLFGDDPLEVDRILDAAAESVRVKIREYIFAEGELRLEEAIVAAASQKGITLSAAESCTGGMITARIVNAPGASKVFDRGFVTYSNEAKSRMLGVRINTLKRFGAVSPETAVEMAEGALAVSGSTLAISVTGIAGPDGGTPAKPVGLVFIALASDSQTLVERHQFIGSRADNRERATLAALNLLWKGVTNA